MQEENFMEYFCRMAAFLTIFNSTVKFSNFLTRSAIVCHFFQYLGKFVLSYVKSADTAKEITHEALVKLWLHRETIEKRKVQAPQAGLCHQFPGLYPGL